LGIPVTSKVLAFVAMSTTVRRKGFALLAEALGSLEEVEDLVLLSVGSKKPELDTSIAHLHLGRIYSDRLLAAVYSAADAFVIPSLEDNLPNTVLESLACGTPVVGFDTGGIPDMVRDGETGCIVPAGDVSALRNAIVYVLQADEERAAMGARCRKVAVDEYSLDVQARRYTNLYTSLLDEKPVEASVVTTDV
jgi:glycosyltransferase involved in cell wall biosynthesis